MKIMLYVIAGLLIICISMSSVTAAAAGAPYMVATVLDWTGVPYDIIEGQFKCVDQVPCTYYALHNWYNDNTDGVGYAGFQYKDGKTWTILSIWDTTTGFAEIEYSPDGAVAEPFGGEGEGMHVLVPYNWEVGVWYTMRIQAITSGNKTYFEQWVAPENGSWTKLAVISYSKPNLGFMWDCFFLEDWAGNGYQRSCQLRGYYARRANDQKWESLTDYYISNDNEMLLAYSFCCTDAVTVYIQSGGNHVGVTKAPATLSVMQASIPEMSSMIGH